MHVEVVYLIFFGIFGLAPFRVKINESKRSNRLKSAEFFRSTIGCFYVIFLIILILGLGFTYFWIMFNSEVPNESSITRKIRISMKIAGTATIVTIWANYCWKSSKIVATANTFMAMNTKISHVFESNQPQKKYVVYYLLIILHIILCGANLYTTYLSDDRLSIGVLTNIFDLVIGLYILQYAITLGIIKDNSRNMFLKLSELSDKYYGAQKYCTFVKTKTDRNDNTLLKVATIRKGYAALSDVCDDVSQLFGFPILYSLTYAFGVIVYYSHYALSHSMTSHDKSLINTIDGVLPLISIVSAVTVVCIFANDVVAQMQKFADVVYKLLDVWTFQREIKTELEVFSYEVSHRKISFQACSLFSIDCGLLRSIFSMTATYLILLLQVHNAK